MAKAVLPGLSPAASVRMIEEATSVPRFRARALRRGGFEAYGEALSAGRVRGVFATGATLVQAVIGLRAAIAVAEAGGPAVVPA
jgi:hypothetical protein